MNNVRMIDEVAHVWDIFENAWVTVEYWEYINGITARDPKLRTLDRES